MSALFEVVEFYRPGFEPGHYIGDDGDECPGSQIRRVSLVDFAARGRISLVASIPRFARFSRHHAFNQWMLVKSIQEFVRVSTLFEGLVLKELANTFTQHFAAPSCHCSDPFISRSAQNGEE